MNRRELLIGAAALAVAPKVIAARRPRVLLGCETYSIRDLIAHKQITLDQVPDLYKQLDITGISWNDMYIESWDNSYLDRLIAATKAANRVTTSLIIEGNVADLDDEKRRAQIEGDVKKIEAAGYLGAPVVRVNLGGTGSDAQDDTVGIDRCIDAFKRMLPTAKRHNVKITIENHGGCSKTADRVIRVIEGTDRKWVGSCLDFGNWPANPTELRYTEIQKLAPYAYHVHAKTHGFNDGGEEMQIDYKRVLGMMKAANYRGAISIEWEGYNPKDPIEGVKKTRDLIRRYWPGI